ncbi:MAG TPA: response regulator [Ktedonobacterales bacterium]|jgi:two-component system chemotaxis response regulator CheY|nr:response regulator [Ktedonobacterales bacterium]HEX5571064.1 response regulator [Ktedonobacterales bacterium]
MASGDAPILAVDDSASIREMITSVLKARGYEVTPAADGREALQKLRTATRPHIVLLDIVMPLLDGIAVVHECEQDQALKMAGHRFVLMSSTVRMSQPDVPTTVGQLAKPFTRQQLIETVEALERSLRGPSGGSTTPPATP